MSEAGSMVQVPERTTRAIDELEVWSSSVSVSTEQERDSVLEVVRSAKAQRKAIDEVFNPSISQAHELHKGLISQKRRFTDRLDAAEKAGKKAILAWEQEQERVRRAEQARLQAIADEQARRERERLEKEAARLKTPELKQARLEEAAAVEAAVVQVAEPEKAANSSIRKTWKARVADVSLVPREYMVVNETALNGVARATKGSIEIPGVEFYEDSSLAVGRG